MTDQIKHFLEKHADLITEDLYDLFLTAADMSSGHYIYVSNLVDVFDTAGIDTKDAIHRAIKTKIAQYIRDNQQIGVDDRSHSWSRLDYMCDELNDMGMGYQGFKQYILDHADEFGLKIKPLSAEYGWYGDSDYDLGWFNKQEYLKEYPQQ